MNYYPPESDFDFRPDGVPRPVTLRDGYDRPFATGGLIPSGLLPDDSPLHGVTTTDGLSKAVGATVGDTQYAVNSGEVWTCVAGHKSVYDTRPKGCSVCGAQYMQRSGDQYVVDVSKDVVGDLALEASKIAYNKRDNEHSMTFMDATKEAEYLTQRFLNDEEFTGTINGESVKLRVIKAHLTWEGSCAVRQYVCEECT